MSTHQCTAVTYGIDLGKTSFHVVGLDACGSPIKRAKLTRATITRFFVNIPAALIGMEACPGSQWLARKLQALGHQVRIVPAQFVKPYVKSNKNDTIDAAAITRPTMRFVQIKHCDQVDLQALHRSRDLLMTTRTRVINQMRAFCLEYGVAMRNGVGAFKTALPTVLGDEGNDLTPAMRELLVDLAQELTTLEERIAQFTRKINAQADASDSARRLATIPGVGQLTATALVAAVPGQTITAVRVAAEEVLQLLAERNFRLRESGESIGRVTASAAIVPDHVGNFEVILRESRAKIETAMASGGNRVEV